MSTLSGSLEDYLEAIYILQRKNLFVRITDVAQMLSLSKPSVNRAVKTLKEEELLRHEKYGKITLTEKGEQLAKRVYSMHKALMDFLVNDVGIDVKTAEIEACRIEHDISEESLNKLVQYARKNRERE